MGYLNFTFFLDLFQFNKLSLINIVICSVVGLTTIIFV